MSRFQSLSTIAILGGILAVSGSGAPAADGGDRVQVTNFPDVQAVRGSVRVPEPIPQATLHRVTEVVGPVDRAEVIQLVDGGVLNTEGWGSVVLSLAGTVKGPLTREGRVGVVLVPTEEEIDRIRLEESRILFPLEVIAPVTPGGDGLFEAQIGPIPIAFPRYRILYYNESQRAVEATVYAYLVNG